MILLRPLEEKDLDKFLEIRNSCAKEFLHDPRLFTKQDVYAWFLTLPPEVKYYRIGYSGPCIEDKGLSYFFDEMIGYFRTREYTSMHYNFKKMEIGADLAQEWRGQGLGFKSYKAFFESPYAKGIKCFTLEVLGSNTNAYNLYRKLGFGLAGVTEVERDGKKYPSIQMRWSLF